ncbi:MAG: helix-turn-helix domain-containing protein, partial [Myroides sp.]
MNTLIEKYKGIHPGIVLNRLLDKKHISQRPFALMIGEYPQTINAITKGRRKLNTALALKIEKQLELQEGTLAILQTYFDIEEEKQKASLFNT